MEHKESFERFKEGLTKAASRARELSKSQHNRDWDMVALQLDKLCQNGSMFYTAKALTHKQALGLVDQYEKKLGKEVN